MPTSGRGPNDRHTARARRRNAPMKFSIWPCCHGAPAADVNVSTPHRCMVSVHRSPTKFVALSV
eukprot:11940528-Alexandrium_andersonii.AAC.1